jgi:site-specific DNA-methyltransferase (adenine-specific)
MTLYPIVQAFSKEGDVVLDPFCGSASALVAARDLGRQYVGIEMSEQYAKIAQDRMQRGN